MGEATFYLIAFFDSKELAEEISKYARYILKDLAKFHDDWHEIRHRYDIPVHERHRMLLERHPLVAKFIELPEPPSDDDVNMNYLAGKCEMHDDFKLSVKLNCITLSCYVWHLADWNNIKDLFYKLGAKSVTWWSDEYVDHVDAWYLGYSTGMEKDSLKDEPPKYNVDIDKVREEITPYMIAEELNGDA